MIAGIAFRELLAIVLGGVMWLGLVGLIVYVAARLALRRER